MRLNKFIANNSKYSRRKADELIEKGKVFLNGKKVTELGLTINPETDQVKVSKDLIRVKNEKNYFALNKPAGYISTRSDEKSRDTVMKLLPKIPNLRPVGRLDKETEGLMLFSNDGDFIYYFTHPKFECEKEYFVKVKGELSKEKIDKLETGIVIDGKKTSPAKIELQKITNTQSILTIVIHEGRKRQIRKMFAKIKCPVIYLKRLRIGTIKLNSLPIGQYRKLTKAEINAHKFT